MKALVLGANSEIAAALARTLAQQRVTRKASFILLSRDLEELELQAKDLQARFDVQSEVRQFDATDPSGLDTIRGLKKDFQLAVVAFGYLGSETKARHDSEELSKILAVNFNSAVQTTELIAEKLVERGQGTIIGISSVAGVRVRSENCLYGSAKAGYTAYLSGLRRRLSSRGIHVMTVLPGYVLTKMTAHLDLPPLLTSTPDRVSADIFRGYKKRRTVVYTPWYWRWIMLSIRQLPEPIFDRL